MIPCYCDGIDRFYGHSTNGLDPRDFTPDHATNTPEEVAAWEKAVAAIRAEEWEEPCPTVTIHGREVSWGSPGAWGWGTIAVRCECGSKRT